MRSLRHNKIALFGLVLIFILVFTGVFAPLVAPYDPYKADLDVSLQAPSTTHIMGTDEEGRDVLSRVIYGARLSLEVEIPAIKRPVFIGVILVVRAGCDGVWYCSVG